MVTGLVGRSAVQCSAAAAAGCLLGVVLLFARKVGGSSVHTCESGKASEARRGAGRRRGKGSRQRAPAPAPAPARVGFGSPAHPHLLSPAPTPTPTPTLSLITRCLCYQTSKQLDGPDQAGPGRAGKVGRKLGKRRNRGDMGICMTK